MVGIVMALVMIFAFLPMVNGQAYAATDISRVDLTYDPEILDLNTAYTEGEIYDLLNSRVANVETAGVRIHNVFLDRIDNGMPASCSNSPEYISADKEYVIAYYLRLDEGYAWYDGLLGLAEYTSAAACHGFEVYVNGTKCTDYHVWTDLYPGRPYIVIFVPLPAASDTPVVKSVAIAEGDMSLEVGSAYAFTGTVTGNAEDKSILWSVTGAESGATEISSEGVLTIGGDETAPALTVTATAAADPDKSDSVIITVLQEPPVIDSIRIDPSDAEAFPGDTLQFSAAVEGTQTDKSVIWEISCQTSTGTRITDDGLLILSSDESADAIHVRVTAVKDSTKTAEAVVTVSPLTIISRVDLGYDPDIIDLNPASTEGDAFNRLNRGTQPVSIHTAGVLKYNVFLDYFKDGMLVTMQNSTEYVSTDKEYVIAYYLRLSHGYKWNEGILNLPEYTPAADCAGFEVYVNGEKCTDYHIWTSVYPQQPYIVIFVPIDVKVKPGWLKVGSDWYYFNKDGTMAKNVWKKDSKGWCYLGDDGKMITNGWAKDSKGWCWIGSAGYMVEKTQWIKADGDWYYIEKGYRVENKWKKDSKGWCYLGSDGKMVTNGWAKDSKGWCWIGPAGYMVEKTQWIKYDGGWYYIEKGYRVQNSWRKDSKGWCYLGPEGRMVTNDWVKDSKGYCWIGSEGYMAEETKWIEVDGDWYHITKGYRDQKKWMKDSIGWCYLGDDGKMMKDEWLEYNGHKFYLKDSGYMACDEVVTIDGVGYLFDENGYLVGAGG